MTKWEYTHSQDANARSYEAMRGSTGFMSELNKLGQDGWEVVA